MLGANLILKRKMPEAFIRRFDADWHVIRYMGHYEPYPRFDEKLHYGVTIAVTKSRAHARMIARQIREK